MDARTFWQLLEDVCQLGAFIAATGIRGASIDLVGTLRVAYDGPEYPDTVLEKPDCHDHIHITPEDIRAFHFGYCEVTTGGADPCIELINVDGQSCLRLYYYPYRADELKPKYEQFMAQHQPYRDVLTGEW